MSKLIEQLAIWEQLPDWGSFLLRVGLLFLLAWIISRLSGRIASRLVLLDRFSSEKRRLRPERLATLQGLIASIISFLALVGALLVSLSLVVAVDTLIWMVGLFSAAFGLGARPLISDFLTGVSFIFENTFDVGEKAEFLGGSAGPLEGVVEQVNLRTTLLRANTGEVYTVPNGEIRVVRNFSRGRFSSANVTIRTSSEDLPKALTLLEELSEEAVVLLPNLLEPWQIISESGVIGQQTELTLVVKARYGKAAELRTRLIALVQKRFVKANIPLAN